MQFSYWQAELKKVFGIDIRSIALFRVLLALIILWDLILRSQDMLVFYTDFGILPRDLWLSLTNQWHWSLHAASGKLWWQILLFIFAGIFAIFLLIGYRAKLMAIASFIMLASLINRNGLILQGGDELLIVMSFWSLFLPLGAYWSIDNALQPELKAVHNPSPRNHDSYQYFSIATTAIVFQILYLYFFTALLKTGDAWTTRFDAAYYAISLDHFATPIAIWARQFSDFFIFATKYVLTVEFLAPALVLLPFFWPWGRILGLLLLASLHVGFLVLLHIGLFPFIDFMALSLLIPSAIWIYISKRKEHSIKFRSMSKITIYYDEDCGFCLKMCLILREILLQPNIPILKAQGHPDIYEVMLQNNSWVITDGEKNTYIHWYAMQFLFSQRLLFKPLAVLMKIKPLMFIGNVIYKWVALNRSTMGNLTSWLLPWKKVSVKPSILGSIIAVYFFIAVTLYNISGIPKYKQYQTDIFAIPALLFRLNQNWSMFAPFPLTYSLYPQVLGKARSGDAMNLFPSTKTDPLWKAPVYLSPIYGSYRWRKYMEHLDSHNDTKVHAGYGSYFCKKYNQHLPNLSGKQLASLEVWINKRHTNTTNQSKEVTRRMIWRHWCFDEFK